MNTHNNTVLIQLVSSIAKRHRIGLLVLLYSLPPVSHVRDAYPAHDIQPRHVPRAPEPVQGPRFEGQTTSQASWAEKALPMRGPRADVDSCHPYSQDAFTATSSYQNDNPVQGPRFASLLLQGSGWRQDGLVLPVAG